MVYKAPLSMAPGHFYEVSRGLYILAYKDIEFEAALHLNQIGGPKTLYTLFEVYKGNDIVGTMFKTGYQVQNGGSYLLAYLESNDIPNEGQLILRSPNLVIYNYINKATLAICPLVKDSVRTVVEEQ